MYRILREELRKDRKGNDEVFLQIEIDNDGDVFTKAEWMAPADVAKYVANNTHVDIVATAMANRSIRMRAKEVIDNEAAKALEIERIKLETAQALLAAEELKNKSLS